MRVLLPIALALSMVPVTAFDAGDALRDVKAHIVTEGDEYVAAMDEAPVLRFSNGYTDDLLTITHAHAAGTTLDVAVTKTAGPSRLALSDTTASLSPGGSLTVTVRDTNIVHSSGTFDVDVHIEVDVLEGSDRVGRMTLDRAIEVVIS